MSCPMLMSKSGPWARLTCGRLAQFVRARPAREPQWGRTGWHFYTKLAHQSLPTSISSGKHTSIQGQSGHTMRFRHPHEGYIRATLAFGADPGPDHLALWKICAVAQRDPARVLALVQPPQSRTYLTTRDIRRVGQ